MVVSDRSIPRNISAVRAGLMPGSGVNRQRERSGRGSNESWFGIGASRGGCTGGVARVMEDGWERAAVVAVWSALMSEGFYLMKSANNLLVSTASVRAENADGDVDRERALAVKALLVALARFETLRRIFGGSCFNTDLARNTGEFLSSSPATLDYVSHPRVHGVRSF